MRSSQSGRSERPATPEVRPPGSPITDEPDRNRKGDRAAAREGGGEAAGWPSGQPEGVEPDRSGGPEELERFGVTATRGLLLFAPLGAAPDGDTRPPAPSSPPFEMADDLPGETQRPAGLGAAPDGDTRLRHLRVPGLKNGGRSSRRDPATRRPAPPLSAPSGPCRRRSPGPACRTRRHVDPARRPSMALVVPGPRPFRGFGRRSVDRRARPPTQPARATTAPVVAFGVVGVGVGAGWTRFWGQVWGQQVDLWLRAGDLAKTLDHDPGSARRCAQASQGGRSGRRHRRFVHRGHRSPTSRTGTGKATEPQPEREAGKPPGGPRVSRRAWNRTDREAPRSWSASA